MIEVFSLPAESSTEQTVVPTRLKLDLGTVYLVRLPRKKCDGCGHRRVMYQLRSAFAAPSLSVCATCCGGMAFGATPPGPR